VILSDRAVGVRQVIGVDADDVTPRSSGNRQGPLDIVEGLNDFVSDRFRNAKVVVPSALARGLNPIAVPNCLGVVEVASLAIAISRRDEERCVGHVGGKCHHDT
jgi:hypothetical protein